MLFNYLYINFLFVLFFILGYGELTRHSREISLGSSLDFGLSVLDSF